MYACLSLFVSLGKSRQWDPWLQRPSCHSKSQSHLWHWAPWSYNLWTFVHHLPGWERGETRECGRGKHTVRMPLFLHALQPYAHTVLCIKRRNIPHMILCFAAFSSRRTKQERSMTVIKKSFMQYWTSVSLTAPHCQEGAFPLARWQGKICHHVPMMINDPKWQRKEQWCASHEKREHEWFCKKCVRSAGSLFSVRVQSGVI